MLKASFFPLCAAILLAGCRAGAPPAANPKATSPSKVEISPNNLQGLGVAPDGMHFALATQNRPRLWQFEVFDGSDGWKLSRTASINPGWASCSSIWFSPDGERMVCDEGAASSGTNEFLFEQGPMLGSVLKGASDFCFLRFSRDGKFLTGVSILEILRWEVSTGKLVSRDKMNEDWEVSGMHIPGSWGEQVLVRPKEDNWFLWDVAKRKRGKQLKVLTGYDWRLSLYKGKWAIFKLQEDTLQIIDPQTEKALVQVPLDGLAEDIGSVDWSVSPGGKWIGWRNAAKDKLSFIQTENPSVKVVIPGGFSQSWCFLNEDYACDRGETLQAYEVATGKLALTIAPDLGPMSYVQNEGTEYAQNAYEPEAWLVYTPDGLFAGISGVEVKVDTKLSWKRSEDKIARLTAKILKPMRPDQTYWFMER